mmetsp:Transcript_3753/g.9270  ORF Transcript_3753/g.9270 Transcript_3753/m.9270 type:complete len:245 (+) Transcript_3753:1674-2408(+)
MLKGPRGRQSHSFVIRGAVRRRDSGCVNERRVETQANPTRRRFVGGHRKSGCVVQRHRRRGRGLRVLWIGSFSQGREGPETFWRRRHERRGGDADWRLRRRRGGREACDGYARRRFSGRGERVFCVCRGDGRVRGGRRRRRDLQASEEQVQSRGQSKSRGTAGSINDGARVARGCHFTERAGRARFISAGRGGGCREDGRVGCYRARQRRARAGRRAAGQGHDAGDDTRVPETKGLRARPRAIA